MAGVTQPFPSLSTPIGYPMLAEHIGNHPDCASFRIFAALNARNILYLQAELLELEGEIKDVERNDHQLSQREGGPGQNIAETWYWLGGKGKTEQSKKQLNLILRLREVLHQYS
jgi:hypothetical protein